MLERSRKCSFWLLDTLRGSQIRNDLREIGETLENFDDPTIRKSCDDTLNQLLDHAKKSVKFYRTHVDGLELKSFPVINKSRIKNNFNDFISSKFNVEELSAAVTSGSTGTPFKVLQDDRKKTRNTADTIYFANLANFEIGNELFYLKVWNKYNKKSAIKAWIENIVPVDVTNLSERSLKRFIKKLNSGQYNKGILGYASSLEKIAKYLSAHPNERKDFNIKSIITMSEALDDNSKRLIEKEFGCRVVSRYSNVENGIMAQQCLKENNEFHINVASYFVEILKMNEDEPAENGEPGRIVITDLYNNAMPIIRYDTGDIGIYEADSACELKTPILKRVEGRKMDMIYNTKGELLSSFVITNTMWNYPELEQYQFIQKSNVDYLFKLNAKNKFNRENELIEQFRKYLGKDANISIEYVHEIPLLSSGKRKKVVNLSR